MENFGVITCIAKPSDIVPLLPVFSFVAEEGYQMILEDRLEVGFRYCKRSFLLDTIKFQKSPVGVIDTQVQPRNLLAPTLKSISQVLKLLAQ